MDEGGFETFLAAVHNFRGGTAADEAFFSGCDGAIAQQKFLYVPPVVLNFCEEAVLLFGKGFDAVDIQDADGAQLGGYGAGVVDVGPLLGYGAGLCECPPAGPDGLRTAFFDGLVDVGTILDVAVHVVDSFCVCLDGVIECHAAADHAEGLQIGVVLLRYVVDDRWGYPLLHENGDGSVPDAVREIHGRGNGLMGQVEAYCDGHLRTVVFRPGAEETADRFRFYAALNELPLDVQEVFSEVSVFS